jgi:hypothetical protein
VNVEIGMQQQRLPLLLQGSARRVAHERSWLIISAGDAGFERSAVKSSVCYQKQEQKKSQQDLVE